MTIRKTWKTYTAAGKPPEFAMIPKTELKVDYTYQRPLDLRRARQIASAWEWARCGFLAVSLRENGDFYIIDGQHRHGAAMLISEIVKMPCEVSFIESVKREAEEFTLRNRNRKALSPLDIIRADAVRGEPTAVAFLDLCKELEITPNKSGIRTGLFRPIAWAMRNLHQDFEGTQRVIRITAELSKRDCLPVSEMLCGGLLYIHQFANVSLDNPILLACVRAAGALALTQAANNAVSLYTNGSTIRGGGKVWASGMLPMLERQRRTLERQRRTLAPTLGRTPKFVFRSE